MLTDDMMIEWVTVPDDSPVTAEGISDVIDATLSVLAVQRDGDLLTGSLPTTTVRPGDTIVVAGDPEACDSFEQQVTAGD